MKLQEAVKSRNTTEVGTHFVSSSGKAFARFDSGDSFTAEYEILRADLAELFFDATEGLRNVQYRYGDFVESLEQTEKGAHVTFNGGSQDTFDVIVGADGSTSKTRAMILDEQCRKDSYKFLGWYLAFFSIPRQAADPKLWQWYNAPKGLSIMLRPHRNPETMGAYLCITTPAHGHRDPAVELALDNGPQDQKRILREYFRDAGWQAERVLQGMDQAKDFYMSRGAQVRLPQWTNGRAVLLGDAAFATFGVGTSLAIESAYVLAGELSKIRSSEDVPRALERYEEVFRPLYAKSEEGLPGFPQIAFPQTRWGLWLRDFVLWLVSTTKIYKLFQGGDGKVRFELPSYDWVDV